MEYGLQLYSVRDITQKGLQKAMQQVADLGYSSVEFAGFFSHSIGKVNISVCDPGQIVPGHTYRQFPSAGRE